MPAVTISAVMAVSMNTSASRGQAKEASARRPTAIATMCGQRCQ